MARILVVDDEYSIRRTFALLLKQDKHEVQEAEDAQTALRLLEAQPIDVVLSDIVLPRTTGVSLLEAIAERWPQIRVLLITGEPTVETASQALRSGAYDYLSKPVSATELKNAVHRAAAQKSLIDENERLQQVTRQQSEKLAQLVELRTAQVNDTREALAATEARLSGLAANAPGVLVQFVFKPGTPLRFLYIAERCRELFGIEPEAALADAEVLLSRLQPPNRAQLLGALEEATASGNCELTWQGSLNRGGQSMSLNPHSASIQPNSSRERNSQSGRPQSIGPQNTGAQNIGSQPGSSPPNSAFYELTARIQDAKRCIWAGVFVDITERKDLQAQVIQSDRLATLGTLAAGVAHEVNNPLTYVLNNLQLLIQNLEDPKREELLAEAFDGACRVRDIVKSLQTFSKGPDEQLQAVDLHSVLNSSVRMARNSMRHRARLIRDFGNVEQVWANPSKLGQVFLNLIVNAAQAFRSEDLNSNIVTLKTGKLGKEHVLIEVTDTGPGIAPLILEQIFEPFFTTKGSTGTGLGLYICRDIVKSLDGSLEVDSSLGHGTTFRVILNAAPASEVPVTSRRRLTPPRPVRRDLKILIIDDEPMIVRSLSRLLTGNQIATAHGGKEAIPLLEQESYDVIFCDLMMPECNGMDVYRALKHNPLNSPGRVIFMTGGAFTDSAREFLRSVPNVRLDKPLDLDAINEALSVTVPDTKLHTGSGAPASISLDAVKPIG